MCERDDVRVYNILTFPITILRNMYTLYIFFCFCFIRFFVIRMTTQIFVKPYSIYYTDYDNNE